MTTPPSPSSKKTRKRSAKKRKIPRKGDTLASAWLLHEELAIVDKEADRLCTTRSALLASIIRSAMKDFPKTAP